MSRTHTVLAFDFGLKRIGIASGDTLTRQAAPRPAAQVGRAGPDWERIARGDIDSAAAAVILTRWFAGEGREGR